MVKESIMAKKNIKRNTIYLMTVTIVILLIIVTLGVGYVYYYILPSIGYSICNNEDCLKSTLTALNAIDQSIEPCDDFYNFVCSKNNLHVPLKKFVRDIRGKLLLTNEDHNYEWLPLEFMKHFYKTCRDTDGIDQEGNLYLSQVISELGGWPAVEHHWDSSNFDLTNLLMKMFHLNLPFEWLFRISVKIIADDEVTTFLQLIPPEETENFNDEMHKTFYASLISETIVEFGGSRENAKIRSKKIIEFETQLKKLWKYYDQSDLVLLNSTELKDIFLHANIPFLIENIMINLNEFVEFNNTLIAVNMDSLKNLNLLLSGTSKWTQSNFFIWKLIQNYGLILANPLREKFGNYSKLFSKEHHQDSRDNFCLIEADRRYPMILDLAYKKFHLNVDNMFAIEDMISSIKSTILFKIQNMNWIDKGTGIRIAKKFNAMKISITTLDKLEEILIETLDTAIGELSDWSEESNIFKVTQIQNLFLLQTRWYFMKRTSMDPLDLYQKLPPNLAEYNDENNELTLSYIALDDYISNEENPVYLNYGILGTSIAKEISKSLKPDALDGEKQLPDKLWKNGTDFELFIKTRCLIRQENEENEDYEDMVFTESYATITGIDFAYESYQNINSNFNSPLLTYTSDQMFFIFYGISLCDKENLLIPADYVLTNLLKHSKYFSVIFDCPAGSYMNPYEKCVVF